MSKTKLFLVGAVGAGFLLTPVFSYAVTVGPVKLEYLVNPGEVVQSQMFVQNEETEQRTFYPSFEEFTEKEGQKVFSKVTSDLPKWFVIPSSVTLEPSESRVIPITINIPKDASPGSHFAVAWWGTAPPSTSGGEVSIVTRAGALVYLTVRGDIHEDGGIVSIAGANDSHFFTSLPVDISVLFEATGNVYLKPRGFLTVTNTFGIEQGKLSINPYDDQIFPRTVKNFTVVLGDSPFFFGPYRVSADLIYGEGKLRAVKSVWIWIFPLLNIGIALGTLAFVFVVLPFAIRRYNRWIVSRVQK